MRRTLVIGDIHGCLDELKMLLRACGYVRGDRVVLAGDLVAKGPDSQGVVSFAREHEFLAVLGNHDASAIKHRHAHFDPRGQYAFLTTFSRKDWEYLESLPLYLHIGKTHVVVHAGLVPGIPFEKQERDHMLAMRSIDHDGHPTSKLLHDAPWGARWRGPEYVIFGHDAVRGLQRHPMATGLDTGCVYGRQLTAIEIPSHRIVHISAHRRYAP